MLISNKLHSFRNFVLQRYKKTLYLLLYKMLLSVFFFGSDGYVGAAPTLSLELYACLGCFTIETSFYKIPLN